MLNKERTPCVYKRWSSVHFEIADSSVATCEKVPEITYAFYRTYKIAGCNQKDKSRNRVKSPLWSTKEITDQDFTFLLLATGIFYKFGGKIDLNGPCLLEYCCAATANVFHLKYIHRMTASQSVGFAIALQRVWVIFLSPTRFYWKALTWHFNCCKST